MQQRQRHEIVSQNMKIQSAILQEEAEQEKKIEEAQTLLREGDSL